MKKSTRIVQHRLFSVIFLLLIIFMFNSCIGLAMDIQMRKNGAGKIIAEYRVSRMAETIGRLDGNENWPMIPVGRADFERSISRIEGMKIASYSSRETGQEVVTNVTLEFDNPQALLNFLDPAGARAALTENSLTVILNEPVSGIINRDLLELMRQVSTGYRTVISFSAEDSCTLTVTDGAGREAPVPSAAQTVLSGRKVSLSIDTAQIFELSGGLGLKINW